MFQQFSFANLNKAVQVVGNILAPLPEDDNEVQESQQHEDFASHNLYDIHNNDHSIDLSMDGSEDNFLEHQSNFHSTRYESELPLHQPIQYDDSHILPKIESEIIDSTIEIAVSTAFNDNLKYDKYEIPQYSAVDITKSILIEVSETDINYQLRYIELQRQLENEKYINEEITLKSKKLNETIDRLAAHQDSLEHIVRERNQEIESLSSNMQQMQLHLSARDQEFSVLQQSYNDQISAYCQLEEMIAVSKAENGELLWALQTEQQQMKGMQDKVQVLEAQATQAAQHTSLPSPSPDTLEPLQQQLTALQCKYDQKYASENSVTVTAAAIFADGPDTTVNPLVEHSIASLYTLCMNLKDKMRSFPDSDNNIQSVLSKFPIEQSIADIQDVNAYIDRICVVVTECFDVVLPLYSTAMAERSKMQSSASHQVA